jgi:hypothetical protein
MILPVQLPCPISLQTLPKPGNHTDPTTIQPLTPSTAIQAHLLLFVLHNQAADERFSEAPAKPQAARPLVLLIFCSLPGIVADYALEPHFNPFSAGHVIHPCAGPPRRKKGIFKQIIINNKPYPIVK